MHFIGTYGYWALFVVLLVEGQPFIIFAGFLAFRGYFRLEWIILFGLPAVILGDFIFHQIAYFWGRKILDKYGRFLFLSATRVIKLESFFQKHGSKVIFFSKFIYGLGRNILIVAGLLGRPYKQIIKYDVAGCFASLVIFTLLGYYLGHSYLYLNGLIEGVGFIVIALILLIIILERFKVWRLIFKNNKSSNNSI